MTLVFLDTSIQIQRVLGSHSVRQSVEQTLANKVTAVTSRLC